MNKIKENIFTVDDEGKVFLNGVEIKKCLSFEIKGCEAFADMEVTIRIAVDEIDVKYGGLRNKI